MNVAILALGTREDMQPYVALGAGLKESGHEVTLVTGKGFEGFVEGRGLRFAALGVDPLELAQSQEGRAALRSPKVALRVARADARDAENARRRVGGGRLAGSGRRRLPSEGPGRLPRGRGP